MKIKTELLKDYLTNFICSRIEDFEFNADDIAECVAINALGEIQKVIKNDKFSNFEIVEEIINIFEKYKLDYGVTHDFG